MQFDKTTRVGKGFEFEVISFLLKSLEKTFDVFMPASDDNGCDCLVLNNQNSKTISLQIKVKQNEDSDKIIFGNIDKKASSTNFFLFHFQSNWSLIPFTVFNFSDNSTSGLITVSKSRFNDEKFLLKNGLSDLSLAINKILS